MNSWTLQVRGVPRTKARARRDGRSRAGGHFHTPDTTSDFEALVAGAAIEAGVKWEEGFSFAVEIEIWLPNRRAKDGDNVAKVVLDGLQKAGRRVLPSDDLFHVPRISVVLAGVSPARPRLEIRISQVEAA